MTYNVAQWVRGSSPLTRGKPRLLEILLHGTRLIPAHAGKTRPEHPRTARTGAHPRSRGENLTCQSSTIAYPGSSPLTRGKRASGWHGASCGGLIPAHAGKTDQRGARGSTRAAHPRSRGENMVLRDRSRQSVGSSPLTRGKRPRAQPLHASQRLIPAHAGKTPRRHRVAASLPAHPRSRGENHNRPRSQFMHSGSSPLTRGKHQGRRERRRRVGLIPAHAGKTTRSTGQTFPAWAHPRSRGENKMQQRELTTDAGSSPLTRGKLWLLPAIAGGARLIPAHAGKTDRCGQSMLVRAAHPRSRGENLGTPSPRHPLYGSSPLTRGKLPGGGYPETLVGLIPAHAGKTGHQPPPPGRHSAHPRSRGENHPPSSTRANTPGSSPLTRGKHTVADTSVGCNGLIPAHAGKTSG